MTELKIIATIVARPAYQKDLEKICQAVVDGSRKEEGNVSYELHQDVENPLKYIILEIWKSQAAIDAHNDSVHFQKFVKDIEGKIDSLNIDVVQKIY